MYQSVSECIRVYECLIGAQYTSEFEYLKEFIVYRSLLVFE